MPASVKRTTSCHCSQMVALAVMRERYGLETIAHNGASSASIEWQRRFAKFVSRVCIGHEQQDVNKTSSQGHESAITGCTMGSSKRHRILKILLAPAPSSKACKHLSYRCWASKNCCCLLREVLDRRRKHGRRETHITLHQYDPKRAFAPSHCDGRCGPARRNWNVLTARLLIGDGIGDSL
ncbi:hypothetical protein JG688_00006463 [Phytophthora aleatoria]|uniref:Uncharacterized protein n=1 Tax=Phytophthora aleatoria TaxID=2496075 RepID=A0A8J5JB84_9STRA|nr:hypothetical protein JG688_00006463 [Phytophthora aleatoria]